MRVCALHGRRRWTRISRYLAESPVRHFERPFTDLDVGATLRFAVPGPRASFDTFAHGVIALMPGSSTGAGSAATVSLAPSGLLLVRLRPRRKQTGRRPRTRRSVFRNPAQSAGHEGYLSIGGATVDELQERGGLVSVTPVPCHAGEIGI